MGAIGSMIGTEGGAGGTGFAAPARPIDLTNPVNALQISDAYNNSNNSMQAQNELLAALQSQNGIGNQSQVYNQYQDIAAGNGPNPAKAMLAQSTGANVANQAALMAGQRGAGSNVGLLARQIGQQGAATQQQAAGQAATMQAQQSLNALTGAGNIANTQVGNQVGQTNANVQARQSEQQQLLNAQAAYNNAQVGMQSNINNANTHLASIGMNAFPSLLGGAAQGASSGAAAGGGGGAEGGEVTKHGFMADGGDASAFQGPQSKFGQFLAGQGSTGGPQTDAMAMDDPGTAAAMLAMQQGVAKGVNKGVQAMRQPGSNSTPSESVGGASAMAGGPNDAGSPTANANPYAAKGGMIHDYRSGGHVNVSNPSQKAVKPGNSYANDKIPAVLSEGEVVIPRNVMQGKDPINDSAKFVAAVLAKRGMRK